MTRKKARKKTRKTSRKTSRKAPRKTPRRAPRRTRVQKASWLSLVSPQLVVETLNRLGKPGSTRPEEARLLIASAAVRARNLCTNWGAEMKEIIHEGKEIRDSVAQGILLLCCAHHAENIQDNSSKRHFSDAVQILRAAVDQSSQGDPGMGPGRAVRRQHVILRCAEQLSRGLRASMRDPGKLNFYHSKVRMEPGEEDCPTDGEMEAALEMIAQSIPSFREGRPGESS